MAHYMAINKSGKNLPIFSGWPSVDKGNQIGTIYNREAFIYSDTEDGVEVYFRNSSGRIVQGFYYATDANGNDLFSSNTEAMKALSSCIDCSIMRLVNFWFIPNRRKSMARVTMQRGCFVKKLKGIFCCRMLVCPALFQLWYSKMIYTFLEYLQPSQP